MLEIAEKRHLSLEELDSQAAFELPDRETLLVTVVIANVFNNLDVEVNVKNNNAAVQVCAVVQAINTIIAPTSLTCFVEQN